MMKSIKYTFIAKGKVSLFLEFEAK